MEKKSREMLALMSKEELEALVMHLQDELENAVLLNGKAVKEKNQVNEKLVRMDAKFDVLLELLNTWRGVA